MKKLALLALFVLAGCDHRDNANNTMDIDENLVTPADEVPVIEIPHDPCGRHVVESITDNDYYNNRYYTVNPDGTLSEGVLQGMLDKKDCQRLIKSDNDTKGSPAIRQEGNFRDVTNDKAAVPV